MTGFVHLRCRSAYSILEGALHIKQIASLCVDHAMPAVALTDTNNLFGALEFSEVLAGAGVQPIIGVTLKVRARPAVLGETIVGPDGHLVLLAQDAVGYGRLMALSSAAFLDVEAAQEPHVSLAAVLAQPAGLLALTGGHGGLINRALAAGQSEEAGAWLDRLAAAFGDRLYVELQRHGRPEERLTEPVLVEEAYRRGLALVATNDPHFARKEQFEAHDALMCMHEGAYLASEDRRRVTPEHYFASAAEMAARFADAPEVLATTLEVAQRCAFRPLTRDPILPAFVGEKGRDEAEELAVQARAGLDARLTVHPLADARAAYDARLEHELAIIKQMGFPGYFLIVADFIKWAKGQGIPVGPGRGSGAGSLVAWALTITDLDPLRFGLLFERFLNPERVSMPDFDVDFCQERRGEVIAYVIDKYGADRVAQIITFGTLQARAVLRDVGRVMQQPFGMMDRLAKMVPNNPAQPVTLKEAIDGEPRLQAERDRDPDVARLLATALELEGLLRNASTHAAGVVIADRPLTQLVPLYRDPRSDVPATQFNMKWVEPAGLVKFDFLGLKTLTVIQRALGFLAERGVGVDIDAIPLDDAETFAMLASGAAAGVFQLESTGMRDTLRKMRPDKIEDLIALISLYRPGPMKNIDTYVERKFGKAKPDYLHETLKPILEETYGVIIYQEQVMQIAQVLSGYSLGEADLLRRAMGKKKPEEMAKQRDRFLDGAATRGVDKGQAARIFDLVAEFAGYGFNKSHAAAYALIAYQTAYLKAHYPVEFMAALMSLDLTNTDKLVLFVQEARRMGIDVRPPDVNASRADFCVQEGAVRYALGAVRNVGLAAMQRLVEERAANGPFRSLDDFADRLDPKAINKRMIENLARSGAFDSVEPDRAKALAASETVMARAQAAAHARESAQASLFGEAEAAPVARAGSRLAVPAWNAHERLDEELSAIGFYLSGHPLEDHASALERRGVVSSAALAGLAKTGRTRARIAGIVRKRQERVSAKNGERFAFVALSDPAGELEVLCLPEALARHRDLLEAGRAVVCHVRLSDRDGEVRVLMDGAEPLDEAVAGAFGGMRVHVSHADGLAAVCEALARVGENGAGDQGEVSVALAEGGRLVEIVLPGPHRVDAQARAAVKTLVGVEQVEER